MERTKNKVLFLEDEPTIREVLTEYMFLSGYEVTAAERGDTAVELLDRQRFDLAVLDICVPVEGILMQPYFWQGQREPYLYEMEAVLTDCSGRIMDSLTGQIPLRELRNRKTGNEMELLLNGVPFIPKAVFYSLPDGDAVVRQRQILEDLQQIKRLGSNCVCVKKEEPARLFLEFSRLCDRYGILVFVQEEQGRGEWVYHQDRKVRMEPGENIPDYRSVNNGLFMPGSRYP